MTLKFYGYHKCSTCRQVKTWLTTQDLKFEEFDITTTPPTKTLLQKILVSGDYQPRNLLNTSGQVYRQLNLKDKVKTMSQDALIDLLASHGKLIKRPIVTDGQRHTVGFDIDKLRATW